MSPSFGPLAGLRYGLLGLPLAFVALPLYVLLPNHYAREFGVPLATLGAVLLGARLLDALIDPLLGRLSDRLHARSPRAVLGCGAVAAGVLLVGFGLLFFPQALVDPSNHVALLVAAAVLLALTYAGYSMLSIAHQSWGAMLGGDALQRGRIVGWREGLGLVGVVLADIGLHLPDFRAAENTFQLLTQVAAGRGVQNAQLSLARTAAMLMRNRQKSHGNLKLQPETTDFSSRIETTPWGRAERLKPALQVAGSPMLWESSACKLGANAPIWVEASPDKF